MASTDNLYSRLVGWLKILFPLAALGLLSTLFLFNSGPRSDDAIPFSDIEELAREQRISEPYFAGVADDGSVVTVLARSAQPTGDGGLSVDALQAEIVATDGTSVKMSAGSGAILDGGRNASLEGLVRVETSSGYEVEAMGLIAGLDSGRIETQGPLQVRAPFGDLTAGGLVIGSAADGTGSTLLFNNGVRLIYDPNKRER